MEENQVRIYIDKTLSRCDDCPFIDWDGDFGLYVCRREDPWSFNGSIKIDQANFVIPHNCPFRGENIIRKGTCDLTYHFGRSTYRVVGVGKDGLEYERIGVI